MNRSLDVESIGSTEDLFNDVNEIKDIGSKFRANAANDVKNGKVDESSMSPSKGRGRSPV